MSDRRRVAAGFTLVELMVTVAILGGILLLVPPNLHRFGARSRLDNAANTIIGLVGYCRERSILDGFPVRLEFGQYKNGDDEVVHGYRIVFISAPRERTTQLTSNREGKNDREPRRAVEREWLTTDWLDLGEGVEIAGISQEARNWRPIGDRPYQVSFGPDGSVEFGFAVRVESMDMETDQEQRTITVLVNALTAEAWTIKGYAEMPEQREENDFIR